MPTSLIIVDDFLDKPQALRDAAMRLNYPAQAGAFAGRNSLERVNVEGLLQQVSGIVGEPLKDLSSPQSHAKCRITLAVDRGRSKVHIDRGAYWSGILYLNGTSECRGGTEFFRHKRTDSERAPLDAEELSCMGYASAADMHHDIVEKDSNNDSAWDPVMHVPMRFNRLLLLRPWLWHCASPGFGDRLENGRLVYLMFFASARA